MQDVTERVARFAQDERLFRRVGRILVALSGGPDSVACLLTLLALRERFGFEVLACHFDHKLRASSAEDLQWVRELCATLDVRCLTGEGDVADAAAGSGRSMEEMARIMRYQFLGFVAGKEQADCIATGHTADDQAETVLQRIIRGTGVRGIRGMLPAGPVPESTAQRLIRPMLAVSREETLAICAAAGIEPRQDLSNADTRFQRNRVRAEVLPALSALNPSVQDALIGLAASARELFDDVERKAMMVQPKARPATGSVFERHQLTGLPSEALTLLIEREAGFFKLQAEVNRTRITNLHAVLASGTGRVRFGDTEIEASCGLVRIGTPRETPEPLEPSVLNIPGVTLAGRWRVQVSTDPLPAAEGTLDTTIDMAGLKGALRIRSLAPADRVTRGGHSRKISDVLASAKVPVWDRARLIAIVDSERIRGLAGSTVPILPPPADEDSTLYVRLSPLPES